MEAVSVSQFPKAQRLIDLYLRKKIKTPLFGTVESWKRGGARGTGLRYYLPSKGRSFRINWTVNATNLSKDVTSIDVWYSENETYNFEFDKKQSLVKVLPLVVDILLQKKKPQSGKISYSDDKNLTESFNDPSKVFDGVIELISKPGFNKDKIQKTYSSLGAKMFDKIAAMNSDIIYKQGIKFVFAGGPNDLERLRAVKDSVIGSVGIPMRVSRTTTDEEYVVDKKVTDLEKNAEKIAYEEQLDHLENLVKMTLSGASNALFVAGRGGVGKTHTVEKILAEMGYRDNDGYFKNTGSASAAGIYSMLFRYKDSIVFFDDSDDALKDQESRNLFKAATDTKPVRKLVWNKMGKNVVDPDDEMDPDEMLDKGLIPRYFEFTGKIIFISNLKMDKLDPDGAIRTRAFMIDIDPTDMEVYDFMEKIVKDMPLAAGLELDSESRKHVVELLRTGTSKQTANFRKLSRGLNMMAGAKAAGVQVSDNDLRKMISMYA